MKLSLKIFLALVLLIILILSINSLFLTKESNLEHYRAFRNLRLENDDTDVSGDFSVINLNDNDNSETGGYNDELGPTCISKCIAEHTPNINFLSTSSNILEWNRSNPTKGFCYKANNTEYPFECNELCRQKCGINTNEPGEYDPHKDFSQCRNDDILGCVENRLNIASGSACQITVGCRSCLEKYGDNINNLLNVYNESRNRDEQCASNNDD